MINQVRSLILGIALFSGFSGFPGCDNKISREYGSLEGKISIGPLCPVESVPPRPECLPTAETYKAYPVIVCATDGSQLITHIYPDLDGSFRLELNSGKYMVTLEKTNYLPGSSNLPTQVTINADETTSLNINIDTGIR